MQGDDYSQPDLSVAGKLQRVLAAHVKQCPYAIIQIQLVNHIHPDALPALINALSEQVGTNPDSSPHTEFGHMLL